MAYLLDTKNIYIGSILDKKIYIEIPEGVNPNRLGQVCELLKSLYRLK
jgi:hypothetical protein